MSRRLISRSPDLAQLRDQGYDLEIQADCLLLKNVPYVNSARVVKRGILASKLSLAGDVTTAPDDHTAMFCGEHPCSADGSKLTRIEHSNHRHSLGDGLHTDYLFSAKPTSGSYTDYFHKMTTYVGHISGPAQLLDPQATAQTYPVLEPDDDSHSPFEYLDTATSRAGIHALNEKLRLQRVAIVGVGGTGSYVLDLVAKTPVQEIYLFDGDRYLQHNAFRSPGAASIAELREKPSKVKYLAQKYSKMRRGIVAIEEGISEANVARLQPMDFVFLCMDAGPGKGLIVRHLVEHRVSFVDVGMGLLEVDGVLRGNLRVTLSTPEQRDHFNKRVSLVEEEEAHNEYSTNIQVADLNAFNAALAVIKWKKTLGFYADDDREFNVTYQIAGNELMNDDCPVGGVEAEA